MPRFLEDGAHRLVAVLLVEVERVELRVQHDAA